MYALFQTIPVVAFYSRPTVSQYTELNALQLDVFIGGTATPVCDNTTTKKWLLTTNTFFLLCDRTAALCIVWAVLFELDACRFPSALHLASSNKTKSITTAVGQTVPLFPPPADSICRSLPNVTTRIAWNKTTQTVLLLTDVLYGSRFMPKKNKYKMCFWAWMCFQSSVALL